MNSARAYGHIDSAASCSGLLSRPSLLEGVRCFLEGGSSIIKFNQTHLMVVSDKRAARGCLYKTISLDDIAIHFSHPTFDVIARIVALEVYRNYYEIPRARIGSTRINLARRVHPFLTDEEKKELQRVYKNYCAATKDQSTLDKIRDFVKIRLSDSKAFHRFCCYLDEMRNLNPESISFMEEKMAEIFSPQDPLLGRLIDSLSCARDRLIRWPVEVALSGPLMALYFSGISHRKLRAKLTCILNQGVTVNHVYIDPITARPLYLEKHHILYQKFLGQNKKMLPISWDLVRFENLLRPLKPGWARKDYEKLASRFCSLAAEPSKAARLFEFIKKTNSKDRLSLEDWKRLQFFLSNLEDGTREITNFLPQPAQECESSVVHR
ncbi:MAG: hypothetical protein IPJ69_12005 [Deltaproteobacteria bacterium]|nr:MAG: hypothetical protein IPJ69_12005 [Deltaproteobacteria bacterium]